MNIDVFISHSSKDAKIADAICNTLETNNVRCWLAPRDICPGSDWAKSISNAIDNSKIMVLVFSENSNNSTQVAKELNLAINNKLIVLPFKIDNSTPTGSMKYYLSDTHWLDAINGDIKSKIEKLKDVLISVLTHTTSDTENRDDTPLAQLSKNNTSHALSDDSLVADDIIQQNMNDDKEEQSKLQRTHNISWKSIFIIGGIILIVIIATILGTSNNINNADVQNSSVDETEIVKVGDIITLGSYEQDNDFNNGNESIEWLILDEKATSYILLSIHILEVMAYNDSPGPVDWKECTLRKWLNNEFVNQAFSQDEKNMILSQGQNSDEAVSLLSVEDVNKYKNQIESNIKEFTIYSYDKAYNILSSPSNEGFSAPYGDMSNQLVNTGWWLKTPINDLGYACFHSCFRDEVHNDGGFATTANFVGVRPTIEISRDLIKHTMN